MVKCGGDGCEWVVINGKIRRYLPFLPSAFLAIYDKLAKQFSTLFRVNTGLQGCTYSILNRVKIITVGSD